MPRPGLRPRSAGPVLETVRPIATVLGKQTKVHPTKKRHTVKHVPIGYDVQQIALETVKVEIKEEASRSHKVEWQDVWTSIEAYRKRVEAPVDTCGCAVLGRKEFGDKVHRFETLVSLILSAQTPDLKLAPTMRLLQSHTPEGMTPDALLAMDPELIKSCLATIGMQNQKTKSLLATSRVLRERYDGDIPPTWEELLALPGVGPKIAALTMSIAWNKDVAIAVDTHVHRISNRLGWVRTKNPEATRQTLERWLPKEYWGPINPLLVGFGQTLCRAQKPGCAECPAAMLCPKIGTKKAR
ncbi:hypothetical protein SpCBS45565_g07454 [Spizellomyces sp. 'palustris']|nr:hypothetical protein SpCBS45565_g07454 [Spizellomyces sp. 'palustris']